MDKFEKYLSKAFRFLSFRPRSEREVREYLLRKPLQHRRGFLSQPINPAVLERIITSLKESNFINDVSFAQWWIEQRMMFKPKGRRLIIMELKQKGISDKIITDALLSQESEVINQDALAKEIAMKKVERYKKLPRQEIYQKLGAVLARRGFDWETIKKAIDEVFTDRV